MSGDGPTAPPVGDMMRRLEQAVQSFPAAGSVTAAGEMAGAGNSEDALAAALVDVAAHYGQRATLAVVRQGLPLVAGRLPVEYLGEAGARAGLTVEVVDRAIEDLEAAQLPVIVLTSDGGADVLWDIERDATGRAQGALLSAAGKAEARVRLDMAEVATGASGRLVLVRPGEPAATSAEGDAGWFLAPFKASRRVYRNAIAATVAINLLALAMPLFTMNVYDRVLPNAAAGTLWALAIGVLLATGFDLAIKTLRARVVDLAGQRADVELGNLVFGRVLGARLSATQMSTGVRANTLREFETLREFFNSAALTAFGDLPFLLLFIAIIGVVAGSLVLVPLVSIPVVLAVAWMTQRRLARLADSQFRELANKNAVAVEALAGLETIKAAGGESWAATRWERAVAASVRSATQMRHVSTSGLNLLFALQSAIQIVMVIVGFYMVAAGAITTGALIAATMLAGRAMQPLGQISALLVRLNQARIAYRMLAQMVAAPQERPEGARLLMPQRIAGAVTFDAVTFGYEKDGAPALREVSFAIAPGERVAIVGGIGTGKTTALKLIQGLYVPTAGRVLLDGMPAGQIDPAVLREAVGLALQDGELFQGTIRENVTLGWVGAGDDAVLRATRMAGAFDWISRLPKGLDTPIRERGAGLSGGQKQSVALARALLADPAVMLLDEPTSDMDAGAEAEIVRRLSAGLTGRTIVVVTHRPAMLDLVDRMIVLEAGRKLLDGPKASVLAAMRTMTERATAQRTTVAKGGTP